LISQNQSGTPMVTPDCFSIRPIAKPCHLTIVVGDVVKGRLSQGQLLGVHPTILPDGTEGAHRHSLGNSETTKTVIALMPNSATSGQSQCGRLPIANNYRKSVT
jgi:hypothetical protein